MIKLLFLITFFFLVRPCTGLTNPPETELDNLQSIFSAKTPRNPLYEWSYSFASPSKITLNGSELGACMSLISSISFDPLSISKNEMNCSYNDDDFFNYLAAVPGRKCDYSTGLEEALKERVFAQGYNTIAPTLLYSISLSLNRGNVWNSILTIHQLLRNMARYQLTAFYSYESDSIEQKLFWERFVDIRGDLSERGDGQSGDHPGSWYRLWGIMLRRLEDVAEKRSIPGPLNPYQQTDAEIRKESRNNSWAKISAVGAEVFKVVGFIPEDDRKKVFVNYEGAQAANQLAHFLNTGLIDYPLAENQLERCMEHSYLIHQ
ncbi:MAG: hypothetical protein HOE90_20920 [Bacteriovoracaceae bacterium]|jgi:hypothetical protein|nr:hypothetical protein [Bacteriovoracaceae bacterium]